MHWALNTYISSGSRSEGGAIQRCWNALPFSSVCFPGAPEGGSLQRQVLGIHVWAYGPSNVSLSLNLSASLPSPPQRLCVGSTSSPSWWLLTRRPLSFFLPLRVSLFIFFFPLHLSCILITMETSQLKLPLAFTPSVSGGNGRSLRLDRTSLVVSFFPFLSLSIIQKKIPLLLLRFLAILDVFSALLPRWSFMFKRGCDIYWFIRLFHDRSS